MPFKQGGHRLISKSFQTLSLLHGRGHELRAVIALSEVAMDRQHLLTLVPKPSKRFEARRTRPGGLVAAGR